jgi:glutamate racemase
MNKASKLQIRELPIGVFDSGLGGLTVVSALRQRFPFENIVYLGDNARVPYGTRSAETITRYAHNCADFLSEIGLKMLVVACNTASAVAIDSLQNYFSFPVIGVIKAGARASVAATLTGKVGVIGTEGTIGSKAYPREIYKINTSIEVFQNAAPLLVPLVEEGWLEGEVPRLVLERYLLPMVKNDIDVLMLGCTHYPVLKAQISASLKKMGKDCTIVDSASSVALEVAQILELKKMAGNKIKGTLECYVTDLPASFTTVANRFLGYDVGVVKRVDI